MCAQVMDPGGDSFLPGIGTGNRPRPVAQGRGEERIAAPLPTTSAECADPHDLSTPGESAPDAAAGQTVDPPVDARRGAQCGTPEQVVWTASHGSTVVVRRTLGWAYRSVELGVPVARVVVDVMLKPEILDPQGRAVQGALGRLGLTGVADVRQGKHFVLTLDGPLDDAQLARIHELAGELLSNPVIEDYELRVEEE